MKHRPVAGYRESVWDVASDYWQSNALERNLAVSVTRLVSIAGLVSLVGVSGTSLQRRTRLML